MILSQIQIPSIAIRACELIVYLFRMINVFKVLINGVLLRWEYEFVLVNVVFIVCLVTSHNLIIILIEFIFEINVFGAE